MRHSVTKALLVMAAAGMTPAAFGQATAPATSLRTQPAREAAMPAGFSKRVHVFDVRELPLGEALGILSGQSGVNIVPSREAAKLKVSIVLRDVTVMDALDALVKSNRLYFRADPASRIVQVYTLEEYKQDLGVVREAEIDVFTLLYPNAVDVGRAIRDTFGDRVSLSVGGDDDTANRDLQQRLQRFDLIDGRSQGLGTSTSNQQFQSRTLTDSGYTSSNNSSSYNPVIIPRQQSSDVSVRPEGLSEADRRLLEAQASARQGSREAALAEALARRQSPIYVTVMPRLSRIVVRTNDEESLQQIRRLVRRLDVPTPLVLLEVKVLSIELGDDFQSSFDFQFLTGDFSGGFTTGNILPPVPPSFIPLGGGLNSDQMIFQIVGSQFRARLQMLEEKNRVSTLASPLLMTAHNEVSRIFDGRTLPIVTGFTQPQTVATETVVVVPGSPTTELRDVGTSLLIAPSINADRTVTLRMLQEMSDVLPQGGTIPVPTSNGSIVNQQIDIVRRRTVSGTVVAKEGLAIAVGGLIQEEMHDRKGQVPILGDIPILGFFFQRQDKAKTRTEIVVMIRPYVLTTPAESEAASRRLIKELSIQPAKITGDLETFGRSDLPNARNMEGLRKMFQFHNSEDPFVSRDVSRPQDGSAQP